MSRIAFFILKIIMKGDITMMAMFFAQRVILGRTTYAEVPAVLKDQVRQLLNDSGLGDLAVEA